jgi:hypothetical protein
MLLRHKHEHHEDEEVNTNGWMMSYADMATTLLAMFIVLSTLGKDQTGINLYNGTGSYINAVDSLGLPGFFPNSAQVISKEFPGTHYSVPSDIGTKDATERVIDAEQEQFDMFMTELERHFAVQRLVRSTGQATIDFYEPLGKAPPYLTKRQHDVIWQMLPLLHRSEYSVRIVVWASMPSVEAWGHATSQAQQIVDQIADTAGLDSDSRSHLFPLGQPWRYPNYQRPTMSVIVVKSDIP